MEDHSFDKIVTDFYRAATGVLPWADALERVRSSFDARSANLQLFDIRRGQVLSMVSGGSSMYEADFNYVKDYHTVDPVRQYSMSRGPDHLGQWVHCDDVFDNTFVERDRYYQDFLAGYQVRYISGVTLAVEDSILTGFSLALPKSRGPLSPDDREQAVRLGEHLREALLAHERVRRMAAQSLAGHGLLSSFPYPMFLIDKDRFIAYENRAGTSELESEIRFARKGSRLILTKGRSEQDLSEKLMQLCNGSHGETAVVDMRASAADAPTWLHVSLLIPGAVMGVFGDQPQILATLFDPQKVGVLDPFALANMFKFTPAEAKVAVHLATGLTAEDVAFQNGTAISTVRSQISQVISKLGVQRTTDVVRILRQGEALWSSAGSVTAKTTIASPTMVRL